MTVSCGSGVQGIATMVLESPFYGSRKPHYQFASQLLRVSDLLTLGRSTIEESLCLLDWAGRNAFPSLGQQQASPASLAFMLRHAVPLHGFIRSIKIHGQPK